MRQCRRPFDIGGVTNNRDNDRHDRDDKEHRNCDRDDSCDREESFLDSLCNEIGRRCNAQFAIGESGELEDRTGILDEVGNNFIVLRSADTGNRLFCNACNLQFISFFNQR